MNELALDFNFENKGATAAPVVAIRANSDATLIDIWLRNQASERTRVTYAKAIEQFMDFVGAPLQSLSMESVLEYKEFLAENYGSDHSRKLKLNAVKSLLSFAAKTGYTRFNVGAAVPSFKAHDRLSERIVSEQDIFRLIDAAKPGRDRVLIKLLYASGGRASEIAGLCWRDVRPNGDSGQIRVVGKGDKERYILLSKGVYKELVALRDGAEDSEACFRSQKGGGMTAKAIWDVVKKAGEAVGLPDVSTHWLRHAHASHSLDRGANINVIKETLGHASISVTDKYLHARPGDSSSLHLAV